MGRRLVGYGWIPTTSDGFIEANKTMYLLNGLALEICKGTRHTYMNIIPKRVIETFAEKPLRTSVALLRSVCVCVNHHRPNSNIGEATFNFS